MITFDLLIPHLPGNLGPKSSPGHCSLKLPVSGEHLFETIEVKVISDVIHVDFTKEDMIF